MRIAFMTHQYPGARAGGIGTYIVQAAQVLSAAGHEVHIFTFTLPAEVAQPAGIYVHQVPDLAARVLANSLPSQLAGAPSASEPVYRLALGWLLCDAVRAYQQQNPGQPLEVVEGPDYEGLALPLLLDPVPGLPIVTQLHLCSAIAREGNASTSPDDLTTDALEFAAIALAGGICAPTQNIVDHTRRLSGLTRDVQIISHPMTLIASATPIPADAPVLFVGRLEPRKGTDLMPEAFNAFLARNPDAHIRLVGSDTQWAGSSVRAKMIAALDPGLLPRVHFVGEKPPADIAREFANCRFSICPSLFESFGYVVAESLIAGRPVVVSDDIGATEVAGDAGITFSRGNAPALAAGMEKLWRDPALNGQLGLRAAARAQHYFSRRQTVDNRITFYQQAAKAPKVPTQNRLSFLSSSHRAALEAALHALATPNIDAATPGTRLLQMLEKIAPQGNGRIYLYGAGRHTSRLLTQRHLWESRGHQIIGLIDDHPRFAAHATHLGLPVFSLKTAAIQLTKSDTIILSTDTFLDQFWQQTSVLRDRGIAVYKLYD